MSDDVVTFIDSTGREWTVREHQRIVIGARTENGALPDAAHLTILFESDGEKRVASSVPADWYRTKQLKKLFPTARPDAPGRPGKKK